LKEKALRVFVNRNFPNFGNKPSVQGEGNYGLPTWTFVSNYSEKSKTTKLNPEIRITLTIVSHKEKEEAMSNYVEENIALFEVGFVAQFVHHTHNIKAKHLSNLCEKLGQQDATAFILALIHLDRRNSTSLC